MTRHTRYRIANLRHLRLMLMPNPEEESEWSQLIVKWDAVARAAYLSRHGKEIASWE